MSQPHEGFRYQLKGGCPNCGTVITMQTDAPEDLMLICEGCTKGLAFFDGQIFVVRAAFLEAINMAFPTKDIGKVSSFDLSKRYRREKDLPEQVALKEALSVPGEDCLTTLQRLSTL